MCNALYGRDHLCRFIHESDLPAVEMEKDFEYALGRCLVDDNQADHDTVIAGIRLIAGHDNDSYWTLRAERWEEMDGGSQQTTQELMMTGVDVDGDAVLGQPRNYPPFWEKFKAEQDRCRERSSAWSQRMKSDSEYFTAQDNDRRRQEEARRAQDELAKRQQEEELWRRQQQTTYNPQPQPQTGSGQGGLLEDLKTRALALMDTVRQLPTKWKWIWGIVIFCVIAYAWEECSNKGLRQQEGPVDEFFDTSEGTDSRGYNEVHKTASLPAGAMNFVRQFYASNNDFYQNLYNYTTSNFLNNYQELANLMGDQAAASRVFLAYPSGYIVGGFKDPFFSEDGGKIKVDVTYSVSTDGNQFQNVTNSVLLTVIKSDGQFRFDDFQIVDNI